MNVTAPSRNPTIGQQHTYSLTPAPGAGCVVTWKIDGKEVSPGSQGGGLRVNATNAGSMTVTTVGRVNATEVSAKVVCGGEEVQTRSYKHPGTAFSLGEFLKTILRAIALVFSGKRPR
jgi:hypothetical protein